MIACRWIIRGRVQGVGFRYFTRVVASDLGLRGTVRNLRDGTVEVYVAGADADIAELRKRLSIGPSAARVTRIDETPLDDPDLPPGFEVGF